MAGKRNVSRLRKALNKNNTSDNLKKAAQSVERAARSAAASASVSRGANAIRRTGQSTGSRYAGSGSSSGNYVRNSRVQSNRRQEDKKKERKQTTTKAVMERYQNRTISQGRNNKSAAAKAQYRQNDNTLTKKQKQTLKKNKARYDKGLGGISEGVAKRYGGSLISGAADTVEDVTNYLSRSMPALKTGTSAAKALYDNTVGRADKKLSTKNLEKKLEKAGGKLQKSGQKNIDKAKEGRSKAAQWGIDLGTAATEMGLDALLTRGRGTMGAMYARSYGSAKQSALDEGASEEQARNYGRAIGGLEAATEKMFSVAKPLKSLFGKGVADDVTENLLNKVVSKASTQAGKNAAYHGGKTLTAAITEGLEEMVSEGLDPVIANTIYANAIGKPHSTSAGDVLYAGSVGAAMGGILGGGGQIVEYGQGRRVQNVFGDDGVKTLAKAAAQVDDAAEAAKGAALNEMINRGDGIAAGQANELYRAVYNQEIKDLERGNLAARSADAIMQRENLISPIQVNEETGETVVGRNTVQAFNEQKEVATAAVNQLVAETDLQLPEMSTEQISSAVAAIQTGIGGIDEVNLFTVGNPEARTVYEAVTGKTLPETNQETREMLFEEIGKNRVNSARLETEKTVDAVKGLVAQDMSQYYEAAGQEAFAQAFSDVNVGNAAQVAESLETFDDFYRAGRNGIAYADVISAANPAHGNVSADIRQAAWQAGQQDAFLAADTARGLQMRIGETARRARSQRRSGGRLYSDISKENRSRFAASQQSMYRMLARTFGIDIHVVDSLESGANGEYHDGVIYLSMSSDRALEYVFAHEITHHMQDYAPEEYNQLKELVRTRWAQQGGIDDAIDTKMAQYAQHDAKLTREQALDEIIADSTYEMLQDEEFIDEVSKTHRNIAQALLDAIKEVLKKLRLMIAGGDRFAPAQNEALLSELDILKEFEKMWTDGLMRAAENRAAVGSVSSEVRQQAAGSIKPFNITRDDIADNIIKVANMEPVAKMTGEEFAKGEKKLSEQVNDYYDTLGNIAHNDTIGDVELDYGTIMDDISHGVGRKKAISFRAVPDVIEHGEIIDTKLNRGNREYDTVVLAAPVTIGSDKYVMGVIVRRIPSVAVRKGDPGAQRHYVHEVMIEKISTDFKTGQANLPGAGVNADSSMGSLLHDIIEVKNGTLKKDELLNRISPDEGRFSLKEPIEETNDLIAQHNLSAENLRKAFRLGGFPMPSIAITKADVGHTNFGEISLIFDKATIDPADSRNKVYGADAWTPTFPAIDYEINDKKASKIYAKANKAGHVPFLNPTDFHPSNMESRISNKGEQGLIEHYKDDYGLKQMYLVDIGETPVDYVQTTVREEMSDRERREGQWYLDNEPELCESFAKVRVDENPMKWRKDNIEKLREAYKNYLVSEGIAQDAADEVANAAKAYEVSKPLLNAEKIKNGKDVIERTENDFTATKEVIDKKINEEDYEKWFSELFSGIEKNSGVWNGKDPYMPSGNRRSFAATHYPVTLDNIVSAMLAQADSVRNADSVFVGTKTIRAAATESFGSIEGIKAASGKIKKIDTDEYNVLKDELDNKLAGVMSDIVSASNNNDNQFIAMDNLGYAIEEACERPTVENIKETVEGYKFNITDEQAQEINNIINEVVDMPVNMFEAKPLRAVGFDEVRAAVVPNDIEEDIKSGLADRGVEVFEYESDNDADRINKVNAAAEEEGVRFSLKEDDSGTKYTLIDAKDISVEGMSENDPLPKRARAYMREHFRGVVLPVGKTKGAYMRREAEGEYTNPAKVIDDGIYRDKLIAVTELQNLLKGSKFLRWNKDKGTHKDAVRGWNYYQTIFVVMGKDSNARVYSGEVQIKRIARGDVFYDITKIKDITDGNIGRGVAAHAESTGDSDNNISQDEGKGNTQSDSPDIRFSLSDEAGSDTDSILYRFSNSGSPMSDWGHAMFSDNEGQVEHYGKNKYTVNESELTSFEDVVPLIDKAYEDDKANDFSVMEFYGIDENIYNDKAEFLELFDPADITDAAAAYDNSATSAWLYDTVLEPNGIKGIRTQNGGVVYDDSIIERAGERWYSYPDEADVIDYANEHETEFVDVPPVRDYEKDAVRVRQQTYGELLEQVEKLKRDRKRTKGRVLDERSVREEVNSLVVNLMTYSESYTVNGGRRKTNRDLVRDGVHAVSQIFTALKKGDSYEAITTAELAAQDIVERLELVNDDMFYEYKDLRNYLKNTRLVISEEDAANIPDFKNFKKQQAGRIRIVKQNGMPVDTVYQELVEQYPELFDAELTHPADQLTEIAEVRESLEPYDIMLSAEETQQLVKQTAQDLLDIAGRGKPYRSTVDKYDEKLRLVKARQQEAIRDVRRNERERAERLVQAEREKRAEQVKHAKERADKRVQAERDKARARDEKRRDTQARREAMASIEQNRRWLQDRIAKPTDDKHVPEGMKSALADLLSQMDMQTTRSKNLEAKRGERARRWVEMDELRSRLAEIAKEDGSGEFEYDGYIFEVIDSMAQHMDGRAIDESSTEQLHELDILMKYIVANIRNYNKAFDESIKEEISQLGDESIGKARARQEKLKDDKYHDRSGVLGSADRLLNESMVTPRDFFERLGGGLEKTFMSMRRGMDKHIDNISRTRDFFDELFKPYRNKTAIRKRSKPGSELEHWRDDSQVQTFDVQGGKISLSPAQIMSLYCLSKREQALGHIFGSGIVASRVDKASKLKKALGGKISTSGSTVMVSMEDVARIVDTLTPEQREMADKLQGYLNNECAAWGNEVSMKMYGYRKFTEKNYFPIKSADAYLDSNFEGRQAMERIKNFGFTKGTVVNANNPIMIDDIFSVVADHVNKMSLYNAFAAPISDFMRVYNYKSRDDAGLIHGSVKAAVEDAYGKKAINYINNFMSDLNSQVQTRSEGLTRFVSKSLANYKKSAIGGNLRVAIQQPTAVMRAFTLISPRYFVNAHINPVKNMRDMQEHCQIAKWKAWGFSQVDMARDIDDIMMNNEWSKIDTVTMEIYGALDNVTWSSIWAAVREETKAKHKDVKVDSEEFYQICNERASEIFDKTQVVDSVFHRSQAMRNTDVMSKMLTSFMAEPTRTFNMMRTEYARAIELWHEGNKTAAVGKFNRATSVFVLNAAAVSAAAAIADALRDKAPGDDDDDSWWANFWANFWGNVNPLNMIPMVKDIWGYTDGWGTSNMAMEGWEKLVQGAMNLAANRDAESLKAFCEGLGYVTGLPVKNVMREVDSIFKALGIEVFASEDGEEKKEKAGIFDSVLGKMNIKDGSNFDKVLNHFGFNLTEEEKAQREYDERLSDIKEKVEGLSGDEKQEKIWSEATENYTKYINSGDYKKLDEIRKLLGDLGGDVDKFDESVFSRTKTAYKKNIGAKGDPDKTEAYRYYLTKQGMTEAQISREVIADSDSAKEFQLALCMDDEEAAVTALSHLLEAGITYQDAYTLFVNRTKAIKGADYSTGELAYPTDGTITSAFGYRNSPTAGASSYHEGIDIGAPLGSDVAAADGGKVSRAGWNGGKGYSVTIDHGNGRYTEYNHLNCYYVQKGDAVSKGQIIAAVGSTGVSTGPHLDFRVRESGTYVDPMIYFR